VSLLCLPLPFSAVPALLQALEMHQANGSIFVSTDLACLPGAPLELEVSAPGVAPQRFAAVAGEGDFDDSGNVGLRVTFTPDALAVLEGLAARLAAPMATPTGTLVSPLFAGAAEERLAPGTMIEGRFVIDGHLASGGMGEVYRATHVHLRRPVALKLLKQVFVSDAGMWARFRQEAELVSRLESQHVVRIFDFGQTERGQPWLAMELVEGQTLDVLVAQGPMPPARVVALVSQVCEGLTEAHALGVVHRDLKPANIILGRRRDGEPVAKILDFGIARNATGPGAGTSLTQTGMVVGTPAYLAPEQALAQPCDARADLYSLGCVTFELLTGFPPFRDQEVTQVVAAHLTRPPPTLASVLPALAAFPGLEPVLHRALQKDRAARYDSARAFAEALDAGLSTAVPLVDPSWAPAAPAADPAWLTPPSAAPVPRPVTPAPALPSLPPLLLDLPTPGRPVTPIDGLPSAGGTLEADARVVLVRVELLSPSPEARARTLACAADWGAFAEAADEDGLSLCLPVRTSQPSLRPALAALAMREAAGEAARPRLALVLGSRSEPLVGRARSLLGRCPAGQVVVDASLSAGWADAFSFEEGRLGARKSHLVPTLPAMPREDAQAIVDERLAALVRGAASALLLWGEEGAGRGSFTSGLAAKARNLGAVVVHARAGGAGAEPLGLVAELICAACGVPLERRRSGALRAALESLGLQPMELAAVLHVTGVTEPAAALTAGQAVQALRRVIATGARGRPVVYLMEALEQADQVSVEVFALLAARPRPRELAIAVAAPGAGAGLLQAVPALTLGPVSREVLARWLHAALDAPPSVSLVDFVLAQSRGLPGLAAEWVLSLDERGLLRRVGDAVAILGEVPGVDDEAFVVERLRAASSGIRHLLEAAAVVGEPFAAPDLLVASPESTPQVFAQVVAGRYVRAFPGQRWIFSRRLVRESVEQRPSPERAAMHRRVAGHLLERNTREPGAVDPLRLAAHLARAGDPLGALPWCRRAADQAIAERAPRRLMLALERTADTLGLTGAPEARQTRLDVTARAALVALALRDEARARALLEGCQGFATGLVSAELALAAARLHRLGGRRTRSAQALQMATEAAQGGSLAALIELERSEALEAEGSLDLAIAATRQALALAPAARELSRWHGEVELLARLEARLSALLLQKKDFAGARQVADGAYARWRLADWPAGEARVLMNLGTACLHSRAFPEGARAFEMAADAAARAGDLLLRARALLQQARVLKRLDLTRPRPMADEAEHLAAELEWPEGVAQARELKQR
jgi:serine/threonine-protein kinase